LKAAERLKTILNKKVFTAADKTKILSLIQQGKGFFTVEEDRGKLIKGNRVVATGVDDFVGHIRFNAQDVGSVATNNTGRVIKALNADVLCVVEVENRELLGRFNSQVLDNKKFTHHMVIDGNDERGIDVGLLSNIAFRNIRTHADDKNGNTNIFS